ncbi:MAG: DUF2339 domain-containing protein [Gaiellaceae bacterium]
MLSTDLRERIAAFRARLGSLPEYLSGTTDIEIELGEAARALRLLEGEAEQLASDIAFERLCEAQELERQAAERVVALEAQNAPDPAAIATAEAKPYVSPISITLPQLSGSQLLAWSGGIVTLLGIVFFFVLATNRGWIGPVERVSMGAIASLLVFGAGVWARRRYEVTVAALTAAGAGLAGGYATLLAAAALYDLAPAPLALAVAASIAALGVWTALEWDSETVAVFGLIGAMLVPATMILQGGVTTIGTAFVAAALIAAGFVALRRRWDGLLTAAAIVGAPQIALLALRHDTRPGAVLPVAAVFWLTYLALGIFRQLAEEKRTLRQLPVSLLFASGGVVAVSVARQFHSYADVTTMRGLALLVVAVGYGAVGALLFLRRVNRDLASLVIALGLTAAAIAGVDLLSGATLAVTWSAEAALLGWLAWLTKEARFRLGAAAYLALAFGHMIVFDAPPSQLFTIVHDPIAGLASVIAVGLAALAIAAFADGSSRPALGSLDLLLSSPVFLYATSLALIRLADGISSGERAFALGHVMVVALLAATSLAFVVLGHVRDRAPVRVGGLSLLLVTLGEVLFLATRGSDIRWYGLFPFAAALYATALSEELFGSDEVSPVSLAAVPAAALSLALGLHELAGKTYEGTLGLAFAALIALPAIPLVRQRQLRDSSTLFWLLALALGAYDVQLLFSGQVLALVLAAAALALLVLSAWTGERRLDLAALVLAAWTLGHVIWLETPPRYFVQQVSSPLHGLAALLALVVVALGFAWRLRRETEQRHLFDWSLIAAATLALLSSWLILLGIADALGGGAFSFDWAQGSATMLIGSVGALALAHGRATTRMRLWLFGAGALSLALVKLLAVDIAELRAPSRGAVMLVLALALLAVALAEELLGHDLDFARPWRSLAPLNLVAMPAGVALAVAGIEEIASRAEVGGIDLSASIVIAVGSALFVLALLLQGVRRDAATLLGASAFGGYLFGLIELVTASSVLSWRDIAPALAVSTVPLVACLRVRDEERILVPLVGVTGAAIALTLSRWTPPSHLFRVTSHPASGLVALLVLIFALAAAALLARASVAGVDLRRTLTLAAAAAGFYAVSLLALDLSQRLGGSVEESFVRGEVVLIALWGLLAVAVRELSRKVYRGNATVALAGFLGALALLDLFYQWSHLGPYERALACALLALYALVISLRDQLSGELEGLGIVPLGLELASFGLAATADHELFSSSRGQGLGLVVLGGLAALLAATLYRYKPDQRDFAALFAGTAVVLSVIGIELIGTIVVAALALVAALAVLASLQVADWRVLSSALVPLTVGLWMSLSGSGAPRYLFVASHHPGRGVPALATLIAAAAFAIWATRRVRFPDDLSDYGESLSRYVPWALGVGILYLLSLTVLEIAQVVSPGTLASGLQRGHAAMSACWGVLGLALLYLGLRRVSRAIRLAGLTLLGASLAKLFVYDLPFLSSVQRAASFMAVGAMLLVGGFFYQRLAVRIGGE